MATCDDWSQSSSALSVWPTSETFYLWHTKCKAASSWLDKIDSIHHEYQLLGSRSVAICSHLNAGVLLQLFLAIKQMKDWADDSRDTHTKWKLHSSVSSLQLHREYRSYDWMPHTVCMATYCNHHNCISLFQGIPSFDHFNTVCENWTPGNETNLLQSFNCMHD